MIPFVKRGGVKIDSGTTKVVVSLLIDMEARSFLIRVEQYKNLQKAQLEVSRNAHPEMTWNPERDGS
jgi:hypothetical protein